MDTHPNPPRWVPDPTGRHQYRYWDGEQWTDHVADNGITGSEPVTASGPVAPTGTQPWGPQPGSGVPASQGQPAGGYPPYGGGPSTAGYPPYGQYPAAVGAPWLADPTKVLGRRYGAFFIDALIVSVIVVMLFFSFAKKYTVDQALRDPNCSQSTTTNNVTCNGRFVITVDNSVYELTGSQGGNEFWGFLVLFDGLYFVVLQGLVGATVGKLATGVRVVNSQGGVAGIGRTAVRSVLWLVDGPLTLYLCGIISSAVSRGHRRVGDMVAGTYVVAKERAGEPVVV